MSIEPTNDADLQARIGKLSSFPSTILKLMSLDVNSGEALEEIVGIAETDPPLTARLLSIANSSAHAPAVEVTDLTQAVARVGLRRVADLIYSVALIHAFEPTGEGERGLWAHAVAAGVAARTLATLRPEEESLGQIYLCGLLHDIGRFLMWDLLPDDLRSGDEFGWQAGFDLSAGEREHVGMDHAELGHRACVQLGLPDAVTATTRYHHHYGERFEEVPEEDRPRVALLQFAECVAGLLEPEFGGPDQETAALVTLLERHSGHLAHLEGYLELAEVAELLPAIQAEAQELTLGLGL